LAKNFEGLAGQTVLSWKKHLTTKFTKNTKKKSKGQHNIGIKTLTLLVEAIEPIHL
jgi:hypothetical protein